jgi:hypothetical protein
MRSACICEIAVTVNNIKILNVTQKCFYGEFMSAATIKRDSTVYVQKNTTNKNVVNSPYLYKTHFGLCYWQLSGSSAVHMKGKITS